MEHEDCTELGMHVFRPFKVGVFLFLNFKSTH